MEQFDWFPGRLHHKIIPSLRNFSSVGLSQQRASLFQFPFFYKSMVSPWYKCLNFISKINVLEIEVSISSWLFLCFFYVWLLRLHLEVWMGYILKELQKLLTVNTCIRKFSISKILIIWPDPTSIRIRSGFVSIVPVLLELYQFVDTDQNLSDLSLFVEISWLIKIHIDPLYYLLFFPKLTLNIKLANRLYNEIRFFW